VDSHGGDDRPHLPPPSLWPVGFAIGIVCLLVGIIVSWPAAAVGAALTLIFGFLWIRDVAGDYRRAPELEPETREATPTTAAPPIPAHEGEAGMPEPEEYEIERFPRSKFLEATTLGLGGVIGGIVTVPALGFMVLPAFTNQKTRRVDIGSISDFPEGQFVITTFLEDPEAGEVSRRTAYIRNNGVLDSQPSFTIVSNRCVHLGCPVQPNGPVFDNQEKVDRGKNGEEVRRIPSQPAGFGCPCHGGQYDTEGNRTAGPPVRALDRFDFTIENGRIVLGKTYSVAYVKGTAEKAKIKRYGIAGPGQHVDGIESWLYPIQPPR
jgi:quinol---cytochrome c reductase iron-sulfur subunit, bacillus type